MKPVHIVLAVLVAACWGFNFVVIEWGFGSFPPLLLACLRFILAALPCFVLPRPPIPWRRLVLIGSAWFLGQFALLFTGMKIGMTPGLASVLMQSQVFFTILIAAYLLREPPTARQVAGMLVAAAGLVCIGATVSGRGDVTVPGLALIFAASLSWACGNILLRQEKKVDMLPMVVWLSLVPPLPLFLLSLLFEGPSTVYASLAGIGTTGIAAVLYLAAIATIFCFGIWGHLLEDLSGERRRPLCASRAAVRRRLVGTGLRRALRTAAAGGHRSRRRRSGGHRPAVALAGGASANAGLSAP